MDYIVFDIETKNFFEDVGRNDPSLLDLALIAIYESKHDRYSSFMQEELGNLWPIIEKTPVLVGFNSDHFDIPLLNKYYPGDLTKVKSIDLMKTVKASLGRRLSLNNLAQATLGEGKSGDGLSAGKWWQEGKIDKERDYCIDDVRITKELFEYGLRNKKFKYRDGPDMREIDIDISDWEEDDQTAMTHTLGF